MINYAIDTRQHTNVNKYAQALKSALFAQWPTETIKITLVNHGVLRQVLVDCDFFGDIERRIKKIVDDIDLYLE